MQVQERETRVVGLGQRVKKIREVLSMRLGVFLYHRDFPKALPFSATSGGEEAAAGFWCF